MKRGEDCFPYNSAVVPRTDIFHFPFTIFHFRFSILRAETGAPPASGYSLREPGLAGGTPAIREGYAVVRERY